MKLVDELHSKGWEIGKSPGDGHCLLHRLASSCNSQLPSFQKLSLGLIISSIRDEVEAHMDEYLLLGFTEASIHEQMDLYLIHKAFDNDFADIVPLILARVFHYHLGHIYVRLGQ